MGDLQPVLRQWMVLRMLSARRYGATVREMAEETGASQTEAFEALLQSPRRVTEAFTREPDSAGSPVSRLVAIDGR